MKQTILFAALGIVAFGASAQEVGHVLSSTPVVQQVAVPRQVCNNVPVQQQTSGGGGLLGALAGAGIGSQIGHGNGTAAAMGVGAIAGALLGNNIEAQNRAAMMPQCVTENTYENRTVAWNVTYEYAGRQYNVQMPYDPGRTVRLSVSPMASADGNAPLAQGPDQGPVVVAPAVQAVPQVQVQTIAQAPVVVSAPAPVVYGAPYPYVAPYPYAYPYGYPVYRAYPPVSLSFGFGFGGGHRHRWR
jgi:uncharacterized protein YcfJ